MGKIRKIHFTSWHLLPLAVGLRLALITVLRRGGTVSGCTSQGNAPTAACATCTADMITLTPGNNEDSTTPTLSAIQTTSDDCEHITVTCTAVGGGQAFMQFNVNQGGPINPTGTVVNAPLDCVNGQWVYQQGGQSRVINEVNCVNT